MGFASLSPTYEVLILHRIMQTTLKIAGYLFMLIGTIWFFQGINVLPGSFMTGQIQWAIYGGIAFAAGALMVWAARRMAAVKTKPPAA